MADKQKSGHQKEGSQLQGQQSRGQMSHDDRRQESGRRGGEVPTQDAPGGKPSHMEREKAEKGKGSPA